MTVAYKNPLKAAHWHNEQAIREALLPPFRIAPKREDDPFFVPSLADPKIIASRPSGQRPDLSDFWVASTPPAVVELPESIKVVQPTTLRGVPKRQYKAPQVEKEESVKFTARGTGQTILIGDEDLKLLKEYYPTEGTRCAKRLACGLSEDQVRVFANRQKIRAEYAGRTTPFFGYKLSTVLSLMELVHKRKGYQVVTALQETDDYGSIKDKDKTKINSMLCALWYYCAKGDVKTQIINQLRSLEAVTFFWTHRKHTMHEMRSMRWTPHETSLLGRPTVSVVKLLRADISNMFKIEV